MIAADIAEVISHGDDGRVNTGGGVGEHDRELALPRCEAGPAGGGEVYAAIGIQINVHALDQVGVADLDGDGECADSLNGVNAGLVRAGSGGSEIDAVRDDILIQGGEGGGQGVGACCQWHVVGIEVSAAVGEGDDAIDGEAGIGRCLEGAFDQHTVAADGDPARGRGDGHAEWVDGDR